jgi:hypothetical protein
MAIVADLSLSIFSAKKMLKSPKHCCMGFGPRKQLNHDSSLSTIDLLTAMNLFVVLKKSQGIQVTSKAKRHGGWCQGSHPHW